MLTRFMSSVDQLILTCKWQAYVVGELAVGYADVISINSTRNCGIFCVVGSRSLLAWQLTGPVCDLCVCHFLLNVLVYIDDYHFLPCVAVFMRT